MRTTLTLLVTIAAVASTLLAADGGDRTMPNIYSTWKNGPASDQNYFPIGVWGQAPRHAGRYKAIGINLYMSLHRGPTEEQLAELTRHGMKVICHQNAVGLAHANESSTIIGASDSAPHARLSLA